MEGMSTSTTPASSPPPKPQAPELSDLDGCCGNGCGAGIFDVHDLAMNQHTLRAWQARQASV
jgi:hypothetical protein